MCKIVPRNSYYYSRYDKLPKKNHVSGITRLILFEINVHIRVVPTYNVIEASRIKVEWPCHMILLKDK